MKIPEIIINGKTYIAKKPKIKYWDQAETLGQRLVESDNFVLEYSKFIADGFDGLTTELVEDNIDLADLKPKCLEIISWLRTVVNEKLEAIPNVESQESK